MLPSNNASLAFTSPNPNYGLVPCEGAVQRSNMTAMFTCLASFALVLGIHYVTSAVLPSTIHLALGQQIQTRSVLSPNTAQPVMPHNHFGHTPGAMHLPTQRPFQRKSSQLRLSATGEGAGNAVLEQGTTRSEFETWAKNVGVFTSKVALANFGGLRGVVATESISDGELLISVPKAALITTFEEAEPNPIPDVSAGFWKKAQSTTRLALKLLAEKNKGQASSFAPYIAILPKNPGTPINWDKKQLEELQYPPMVDFVADQQKEWRAIFDALRTSSLDFAVTWENFLWAMEVATTRSYKVEFSKLWGDKTVEHCLLPWVDMINSRSKAPPPAISFNPIFQKLEFRAGESYLKGEQIWVSHNKANDDLLQYYGFVEQGNAEETCCMKGVVDIILKDAPQAFRDLEYQRMQEVKKIGLSKYLDYVCVTKDAPDPRTAQALRVLLTPVGEDALDNKDKVDPALEKLVYQTLYVLGAQTIAAWPTTLAQDIDALPTIAPGPQRVATEYRIEKKRVLAQFLTAVEPLL